MKAKLNARTVESSLKALGIKKAELEAKAQKQMRSMSSYVALVIAENLRGPR